MAPIEDPEVILLVTLYNPTGEAGHQRSGGVAAPIGGQIFSEILPYLEVSQGNKEEVEQAEEIDVPNVIGMSIKEAEKVLNEIGLEIDVEEIPEENRETTIIKEQTPTEGIKINKGNKIFIKY